MGQMNDKFFGGLMLGTLTGIVVGSLVTLAALFSMAGP